MQNVIKKLDDEIIKLISAGEVIESPCSVVKELVENSIDSGATSILVEIKNGGKTYIRVTDNGIGIDEPYVMEAFKKHTTSKITTFDDFINVNTNGFRGEALASISAVAKISMTTKTINNSYGIQVVIKNDKVIEKTKVGTKDGTTVIVEELLEDIPARKKFLKSDKAESTKITDFLIRYALANPNIKIKYINNSKQIFSTYATGKIKDVVNIIFANNYDNSIIEIDEQVTDFLSIKGIIGNNSAMYSSRKMQYIFVNGRIIKDKNIVNYIENAYKKYIPSGNYPMFFIDIIIDPSRIDVNIHPNKLEVKFSDEKTIYKLIEKTISDKLDNVSMIPSISLVDNKENQDKQIFSNILSTYKNSKPSELINTKINLSKQLDYKGDLIYKAELQRDKNNNPTIQPNIKYNEKSNKSVNLQNEEEKNTNTTIDDENIKNDFNLDGKKIIKKRENNDYYVEDIDSSRIFEKKAVYTIPKDILKNDIKINDNKIKYIDLTLLKYGGRVFDTYIMLFDDEDMYMIDQHAAHERILYEKFLKEFYSGTIVSQQLLIPENINIPVNLMDYSTSIIEEISSFGFECDLFGDNIILIRAIPTFLDINSAKKFLNAVFDIYLEETLSNEVIKDKIATKACKAAIKGNDSSIKEIEIEKMLYDLEHCENKYACPHGRPTITRISKYEMEKFFKRIL